MQLLLLFSHRQRYRHRRRCSCRLTTVRSRTRRSQISDTARWAVCEKSQRIASGILQATLFVNVDTQLHTLMAKYWH